MKTTFICYNRGLCYATEVGFGFYTVRVYLNPSIMGCQQWYVPGTDPEDPSHTGASK